MTCRVDRAHFTDLGDSGESFCRPCKAAWLASSEIGRFVAVADGPNGTARAEVALLDFIRRRQAEARTALELAARAAAAAKAAGLAP